MDFRLIYAVPSLISCLFLAAIIDTSVMQQTYVVSLSGGSHEMTVDLVDSRTAAARRHP